MERSCHCTNPICLHRNQYSCDAFTENYTLAAADLRKKYVKYISPTTIESAFGGLGSIQAHVARLDASSR